MTTFTEKCLLICVRCFLPQPFFFLLYICSSAFSRTSLFRYGTILPPFLLPTPPQPESLLVIASSLLSLFFVGSIFSPETFSVSLSFYSSHPLRSLFSDYFFGLLSLYTSFPLSRFCCPFHPYSLSCSGL